MFFIISKISATFLSPIVWIFALIIVGLFWENRRKPLLRLAVIVFILFSNQALFTWIIKKWEPPLVSYDEFEVKNRHIVLLGGYCSYDSITGRTRFSQSSDRLMQALIVWEPSAQQRLVLSGGSANIYRNERGEGAFVAEFLAKTGINKHHIEIDSLSRNTYENAQLTAAIFDQKSLNKQIVLVTSAWHMKRAQSCFEKQGFDVKPLSADHIGSTVPLLWHQYFLPSAGTLSAWELLIREWVGLMMYKFKGYI
jgi:uncharacterized SAM-binding protein YcdF (DUF218 family)